MAIREWRRFFLKMIYPLCFLALSPISLTAAHALAQGSAFSYSGRAEADGRKAELSFTISGNKVSGRLTAQGVCEPSVRLPRTELTFDGTFNGSWEVQGTIIQGQWRGGDYGCDGNLMRDYPTSGRLTISIQARPGSNEPVVFVHRVQSSRYGYVFKRTGRVYSPGEAKGQGSPSSSPGSRVDKGTDPKSWGPSELILGSESPSLGPPRKGFKSGVLDVPGWGEDWIVGTAIMKVDESRSFDFGDAGIIRSTGKRVTFSNCKSHDFYVDGVLKETDRDSINGKVRVWAASEGIGRIYARSDCDYVTSDGQKGRGSSRGVLLVLVGDRAVEDYTGKKIAGPGGPPSTPPDIRRAEITGRAVVRGTNRPVNDAQVSFIAREGGAISRESWKTNAAGKFDVTAVNLLLSGRYEVMVLKRSPEMGTRDDPAAGVQEDLWPVKKYYVSVTRDRAEEGPIDVGVIEMDTVRNIFEKGDGRSSSEERGRGKVEVKTKLPPGKETGAMTGYNPVDDKNLGEMGKGIDVSRVGELGSSFQDKMGKKKPKEPQNPIQQPPTYTGEERKPDGPGNEQTAPPSPPPSSSEVDSDPGKDAGKYISDMASTGTGKKVKIDSSGSSWGTQNIAGTSKTKDQKEKAGSGKGGFPSSITALYINQSNQNAHLFTEGETFGPENRLTPGEQRSVTLKLGPTGKLTFYAGRNEKVISTASWQYNSSSQEGYPVVRFVTETGGKEKLVITTNQK